MLYLIAIIAYIFYLFALVGILTIIATLMYLSTECFAGEDSIMGPRIELIVNLLYALLSCFYIGLGCVFCEVLCRTGTLVSSQPDTYQFRHSRHTSMYHNIEKHCKFKMEMQYCCSKHWHSKEWLL